MKARKLLMAGTAALGFAIPGISLAQETGLYAGAGLGTFTAQDWCSTSGGVTLNSCSDDGTAWKAFAGYRFNRHLAAEVSYTQTDDISANVTSGGVTGDVSADLTAFGLAGLAILPLGDQFSLFGKLGLARTEAEAQVTVGGTTVRLGDNETEAHFGLGGMWNFSRNFGLRAEWERFEKSEIDLFTIGIQYKF
jgi:OOP family OmpA-OmpF porin